jgi:hypothetical protein
MSGFVKLMRTPETVELMRDTSAMALLMQIAYRARREAGEVFENGRAIHLETGEAFVGDCASIGLSEQNYRSAKKRLADRQFATFRATNKGTVARLVNSRVFDINADEPTDSPTVKQRTNNGQTTTNKNYKNYKKEKKVERERPPFQKPTVEEVKAYCITKGFSVDAGRFVDFYESKGWKIGSAPMKSWEAAVRNWARGNNQRKAPVPEATAVNSQPIHLNGLEWGA